MSGVGVDAKRARIVVLLLSVPLYLALVVPTGIIMYRLLLFCTESGFRLNVNHTAPREIWFVWLLLWSIMALSVPVWFLSRYLRLSKYVTPILVITSALIAVFFVMRVLGVLITYGEYIGKVG